LLLPEGGGFPRVFFGGELVMGGLQLKRAMATFTAVLHLFQFTVCVCVARPFRMAFFATILLS